MDGPSLPSDIPDPIARAPPTNFAMRTLSHFILSCLRTAPFTCGIPLPLIIGSNWTILLIINAMAVSAIIHRIVHQNECIPRNKYRCSSQLVAVCKVYLNNTTMAVSYTHLTLPTNREV